MGKVQLNTPEGTINILIEGDEPNVEERIKIANILRDRGAGRAVSGEPSGEEKLEQLFDTDTGIKSASLRSALSAAENRDEEAAILAKFDIGEDQYVRDKRGRLALTPEGAAKFGQETDKNILIDEDGFSRYDLADLAGIAPELIGAVGGAIAGQIAIPIPVLGAAIGAGVGAGTGQGVEEIIEAGAGVSKQSAGDIATDIGKEALIGFAGDGLFGLLGKAFGVGKKSLQAGKELTAEELETAAKSIDMGILPTLSAIRAPSVIARAQGIGEKIFKTSSRLKQNNEIMSKKIDEFTQISGSSTADEAGEALLRGLKEDNAALLKAEAEARKAVLKQFEDTANAFASPGMTRNPDIDNEIFELFVNAQEKFNRNMTRTFKAVDDLMGEQLGSRNFINVRDLQPKVLTALDSLKGATGRSFEDAKGQLGLLRSLIKQRGNKASFNQLYNARKSTNDLIMSGDATVGRVLKPILDDIDNIMSRENLEITAQGAKLTTDEATMLTKAGEQLKKARADFKEGKDILEQLQGNAVLKNLEDFVKTSDRDARRLAVDPQIFRDLIKPNRPQFLQGAIKVLEKFGKPGDVIRFREELSNNFVKDALAKSGIDSMSPKDFSGKAFADAIDSLGTSGDVLFGGADKYNGIKALANQIRLTSINKMDDTVIQNIVAQGGDDTLRELLNSVKNAQVNLGNLQASNVRNKLANGNLNATEAGELIANNSTKATDINDILTYFRTQNDEESIKKIQGYFMNSLIKDFGETVMTDSKKLGKFADRMLEASKGGKLNELYGNRMGQNMTEFAKILKFNARTAEGGDLVAANIAASPIQNLGKLARFGVITRFLTSAPYYDQILKQYKNGVRIAKTDAERAMTLGQAIRNFMSQAPGQMFQESVSEGADQLEALADNYGITSAIENTANQVRTNVRNQTPANTGINVTPPAANTGLGAINVNSPGTGQLLGLSPINQAIAARQTP
jgi:acylphosphatase